MKTLTVLLTLTLLCSTATADRRPARQVAESQGYVLSQQTSNVETLNAAIQQVDRAIIQNQFYLHWFGGTSPEIARYFQGRIDGLTAARALLVILRDQGGAA